MLEKIYSNPESLVERTVEGQTNRGDVAVRGDDQRGTRRETRSYKHRAR